MLLHTQKTFKNKINERITIGNQLYNLPLTHENVQQFKDEVDDWNDYNYEYLKQSFENPNNEYLNSYGEAGYSMLGGFLSNQPDGSPLAVKDFLKYKIDDLRRLYNKADLIKMAFPDLPVVEEKKSKGSKIFIGHGRSKLWARVKIYLKEDLGLDTLAFEDESRASESIVNILEEFLEKSSFAVLIMTAEDDTLEGKIRARQNVVHEAGLFQGRLGFGNVIILKQDNIEGFSNIAGLQYISFSKDNIEQTFYDLQRKMKKLGLIK